MSCVASGVATHPIDIVKTRMQIQTPRPDGTKHYRNLVHGLATIAREEGIGRRGVCKGLEASAMREASYSTLRVGLYEPVKRILGADKPDSSICRKFAAGAIAGMTGSAVANPVDLIKMRMMA